MEGQLYVVIRGYVVASTGGYTISRCQNKPFGTLPENNGDGL